MFDRIAPVYDAMNRVMTAGLDQRWRRATARVGRAARRRGARRLLRHRRPRRRLRARGRDRHRSRLLRAHARAGAEEGARTRVGRGRPARTAVRRRDLRRGHRRLRRPQRRRTSSRGLARAAAGAPAGRPARRSSRSRSPAARSRPSIALWFDRVVPLLGRVLPGGAAYTYLPASVRRFPGPDELAAVLESAGFAGRAVPAPSPAGSSRCTRERRRDARSRRLARAQGLDAYLDELEARLEAAVRPVRGRRRGGAGADALGGGKRLRPLLVFLAAPRRERSPPVAAGVAVELVHMATLDPRRPRRPGRAPPRPRPPSGASHGDDVAVAAGDYLFARAFGELAETGDVRARRDPRRGAVSLSRAARRSRDRQTHDPDTTIDELPRALRAQDREALRGRLPARRRGSLGEFGLALGIAYQIADDVLDCAGDAIDTGKVPGTDLREGTPTLPLLLAAREDAVVREALAGGPLDGVLVRVAATGALERVHARRARVRRARPRCAERCALARRSWRR